MSVLGWVATGLVCWCLAGGGLGILLGQILRRRDASGQLAFAAPEDVSREVRFDLTPGGDRAAPLRAEPGAPAT